MNISPTALTIILALTAAFSSLAGVLVTSIFNYLNTRITKQSEERRHLKEIVVHAAIENWKQQIEEYKVHQQPMALAPLDIFVVHMLKLTEVLLNDQIDASNIEEKMKEVADTTAAMWRHVDKVSSAKHRRT